MGNHDVGRAMAAAARAYWRGLGVVVPTRDQALAALDEMAEDFRGADAEFDDELMGAHASPLARLIVIGFEAMPAEVEGGPDGDLWYAVTERFSKRYGFC